MVAIFEICIANVSDRRVLNRHLQNPRKSRYICIRKGFAFISHYISRFAFACLTAGGDRQQVARWLGNEQRLSNVQGLIASLDSHVNSQQQRDQQRTFLESYLRHSTPARKQFYNESLMPSRLRPP
jgi:hypothetical protein